MTCPECGGPKDPRALRCRSCNSELARRMSAEERQPVDVAILDMVDGEELSTGRLARRLGVSRMQASRVIRAARRRAAYLANLEQTARN